MKSVIHKRRVMLPAQQATFIVLVTLALLFLGRYVIWWFDPSHIATNFGGFAIHAFDFILFALLTFIVFLGSILRLGNWFALMSMAEPKPLEPEEGLRVAFLTCYVPGKEPYDMLERTLSAMVHARYPHDTWVLDEGDDPYVKALCKNLDVWHFSRFGIAKYNQAKGQFRTRTKAGNHNAWRDMYEDQYDIVAQIDMDHVPTPDYFEKTLGFFRDRKVGIVGMPQVYKNVDNWIARGAAEQAYFFHGPIQKGLYGCDMPFLIGTSHLYRVGAMKQIGGYAPTIVEDHLTGMQFYAQGWKGVFVPHVLASGEGPSNWIDYFNQQMRWSYGLFEILFRHTPSLLPKLSWKQRVNYFIAQLYYFSGVTVFLGVLLTFLYLVFGVRSANMNLFAWIAYAFPPFLLANIIQLYVHRFSINPKEEPVFGLIGMFLSLAANVVYTVAFLESITGGSLRYKVTQKGSKAMVQSVPLRTFKLHLLIAYLMVISILVSIYQGYDAIQLRFWALFTIVTMAAVVISNYWPRVQSFLAVPYVRPALRFSYRLAMISAIAAVFVVGFSKQAQITQAFQFAQERLLPSEIYMANQSLAGKVNPPTSGAYIGVSLYQHNDQDLLESIEEATGSKFAIVGYYQSWDVAENAFNKEWASYIVRSGAVPLITWEPWRPVLGYSRVLSLENAKPLVLARIIDGEYDDYIRSYANDIKSFKSPVMIRFAHEMNSNWYPWGSAFNSPEDYKLAWWHVHDIFTQVGATNVTWVWSPNEVFTESKIPYANNIDVFYPGDEYVDWVGFSAFNWAGRYKENVWRNPDNLYLPTIAKLTRFNKPILITETASADMLESPKMKAQWIAMLSEFIQEHEEIKGIVWFNTEDNDIDWSITSTEIAKDAFSEAFSENEYFVTSLSL